MTTFGERVDRASRRLTPMPNGTDLGRQIGIDPAKFRRWLRMAEEPPLRIDDYFELSAVLDVSIFDLMPKDLAESATADKVIKRALLNLEDSFDINMLNVALDKVEAGVLDAQQNLGGIAGELAALRRVIRGLVR